MSKGLGKTQKTILDTLLDRGPYPGMGWIWKTHSQTMLVIESLVNRGLVEYDPNNGRYVLTSDGQLEALGRLSNGQLFRRAKQSAGERRDLYERHIAERGFVAA